MRDDDLESLNFGKEEDSLKSRALRKIQIRVPNKEKIYGPYLRRDILILIQDNRLNGEESILVEGETNWRSILSEPDFFDLFNAKQAPKKKATPSSSEQKKVEEAVTIATPPTQIRPESSGQGAEGSENLPSKPMIQRPIFQAPAEDAKKAQAAMLGTGPENDNYIKPITVVAEQASSKAKKASRPLLLVVLAISLIVIGIVSMVPNKKKETLRTFSGKGQVSSPLKYAGALNAALLNFQLGPEAMPESIVAADQWSLPRGIHARAWIQDLNDLKNEGSNQRGSASYWGRRSWNLIWLGSVLRVIDPPLGQNLVNEGLDIFEALKRKKLVPSNYLHLFEAIEPYQLGNWDKVVSLLQQVNEGLLSQSILDDAHWYRYWQTGAKDETSVPSLISSEEEDTAIVAASQLRKAFLQKSSGLFRMIEAQSEDLHFSVDLWFVLAESQWRYGDGQNPQLPYAGFMAATAVLSLYPESVQKIIWAEFSAFLARFGRQSTSAKAADNVQWLLGNYDRLKPDRINKWWDFGQEGLQASLISDEILKRANKRSLSSLDISLLMVMADVTVAAVETYQLIGENFGLVQDWKKALQFFDQCVKMEPRRIGCLGGQVWANANMYRMEAAFSAYDKIVAIPQELPEAQKYLGVIYHLGREPENAIDELSKYTKAVPQDGWGHYFLAKTLESQEKNVDCLKSASLAVLNGKGQLVLRSKLLQLRCRIMANLGIKQALEELRQMVDQDPDNTAVVLEYVDAQRQAGLLESAIETAKQLFERKPSSFDVRVKLADLYVLKQDQDRALAFYHRALKDRPASAAVYMKVAKVLEDLGRLSDAARNYETAATVDPDFPESWLAAARVRKKLGQFQEMALAYNKELELRPLLATFIEFSEYLLSSNAPQEVPKIFQKYKKSFQDDIRVMIRLAQAYLAMNDETNAKIYADTALARNENLGEAHRVLGYVYDKQGNHYAAREHFVKYLKLVPGAPDAGDIQKRMSNYPP